MINQHYIILIIRGVKINTNSFINWYNATTYIWVHLCCSPYSLNSHRETRCQCYKLCFRLLASPEFKGWTVKLVCNDSLPFFCPLPFLSPAISLLFYLFSLPPRPFPIFFPSIQFGGLGSAASSQQGPGHSPNRIENFGCIVRLQNVLMAMILVRSAQNIAEETWSITVRSAI